MNLEQHNFFLKAGLKWLLLALLLLGACSAPESDKSFHNIITPVLDSLAIADPDSVLGLLESYEGLFDLIDKNGLLQKELLDVKLTALETGGYLDSLVILVDDLSRKYLRAQDTLPLVDLLLRIDYSTLSHSYGLIMEGYLESVVHYLRNNQIKGSEQIDLEINLANLYLQDNKFLEADQLLKRLVASNIYSDYPALHHEIYFTIAEMYFQQGLFEQAKQQYEYIIAILPEQPAQLTNYLYALGNLGITYKKLSQYDSAAVCYRAILDTLPATDLVSRLRNQLNLGNVYTAQGAFDKGQDLYEQVLEASLENNLQLGVVYSKINLANLWIEAGDYPRALTTLSPLIPEIKEVFGPEMLYEAIAVFEEAYKMNGQFREAYHMREQMDRYEDSVRTVSNQLLTSELEFFLQESQQDLEQHFLTMEVYKRKQWTWISLLLILGSLIISGLVYRNYYREKKVNLVYRNLLEERAQIIKERDRALLDKEQAYKKAIREEKKRSQLLQDELKGDSLRLNTSTSDQFWLNFGFKFRLLFPDFDAQLRESYPQLNSTDIRYLKLVKLNLPDETIGNIFNIAVNSVYKRKQRVLEKMGSVGDGDADLIDLLP